MVERPNSAGEDDPPKQISIDRSEIAEKRLHDFVTVNTCNFFKILSLPESILRINPDTWLTNADYLTAAVIVRELRVVNNTAERGSALMQEYNASLTKNEEHSVCTLGHARASQAVPRL